MSISIYTINLASDLFIEIDEMHSFMVNTEDDDIWETGKAVNVLLVLKMLDIRCGRVKWAKGVAPFAIEGQKEASAWILEEGKRKIKELSTLLE